MQKAFYIILCYAAGLAIAINFQPLIIGLETLDLSPRSHDLKIDVVRRLFPRTLEGEHNVNLFALQRKRLLPRGSPSSSRSRGPGTVESHAVPASTGASSPRSPAGHRESSPSRNGFHSPTGRKSPVPGANRPSQPSSSVNNPQRKSSDRESSPRKGNAPPASDRGSQRGPSQSSSQRPREPSNQSDGPRNASPVRGQAASPGGGRAASRGGSRAASRGGSPAASPSRSPAASSTRNQAVSPGGIRADSPPTSLRLSRGRSSASSPNGSLGTSFDRTSSPSAGRGSSPVNSLLTPSERAAGLYRSYSAPQPSGDQGQMEVSHLPGGPSSRASPAASVAGSTSSATYYQTAGSDDGSRVSGRTQGSGFSGRRSPPYEVRGFLAGPGSAHTTVVEPNIGTVMSSHRSRDRGKVQFSMQGYQRVSGDATNTHAASLSQLTATSPSFVDARMSLTGGKGVLKARLPGAGRAHAVTTGDATSSMQVVSLSDEPASVSSKLKGAGHMSVEASEMMMD